MERRRQVYNWSVFRQWLDGMLGGSCALCQGPAFHRTALCPGCRADLPDLGPACERCAAPLAQPGVCGQCLRRPPTYDAALAAFHYQSPLSHLLIDLKFHGRLALARPLGELLAERLVRAGAPRPDAIIPIPLHPQRLRERGYNQALELARPVSERLGVPLAPELGQRLRATASQSQLDLLQRRRNLRGAFGIRGIAPPSVAILDDVITTGSTAGAFARALRRAGVQQIQVWALARAAHR